MLTNLAVKDVQEAYRSERDTATPGALAAIEQAVKSFTVMVDIKEEFDPITYDDPEQGVRLYVGMIAGLELHLFLMQAQKQQEIYASIYGAPRFWITPEAWDKTRLTTDDIENELKANAQTQNTLLLVQKSIGLQETHALIDSQRVLLSATSYQQLKAKLDRYLRDPTVSIMPEESDILESLQGR
jgi:hypothetical protein